MADEIDLIVAAMLMDEELTHPIMSGEPEDFDGSEET